MIRGVVMTEVKPKEDINIENQPPENNKSQSSISDNSLLKPRVDLYEIMAEIRNG